MSSKALTFFCVYHVNRIVISLIKLSALFLFCSFCLQGVRCNYLYLLRRGDGGENGGSRHLRPPLLPWRYVEQTGLLHRHGRVSVGGANSSQEVLSATIVETHDVCDLLRGTNEHYTSHCAKKQRTVQIR